MVYLPNEIWLKIAGYFGPPLDLCTRESETVEEHDRIVQQTLVNLCLISKQLHAIFQPRLYRSFIKNDRFGARSRLFKPDSEWQHKYYQRGEQHPIRKATRLEKFIRTLIHRPDLAVSVERLRIGWYVEDSALDRTIQKIYRRLPLHGKFARTFVDALKKFPGFEQMSAKTRRLWLKELRDGEERAEVALLLIILPNLRFVRIESKRGNLGKYIQELRDALLDPGPKLWTVECGRGMLWKRPVKIQSQPQQRPQVLKALVSLSVWSNCDSGGSLGQCLNVLSLPSLTSFDARGLVQWYETLRLESSISFSSLQDLKLVHCKFSGAAIQDLLTECTKLRSLILNSEFAFDPDDEEMPILGATVFAALQNLAGSLQRLTLVMPDYYIELDLDLSLFDRLRSLEVEQHLLISYQGHELMHMNLPTSIQQLIIRRTTMLIKPSLVSFFDTFIPTPKFPDLTSMKLYTLGQAFDGVEDEWIDFHIRAQQHHVGFEWEGEPDRNYEWYWHFASDSEEGLDSEHVQSDDEDSDNDD